MGWPKGVPRKPKVVQIVPSEPVRESGETKAIPGEPLKNDGVVVSEKDSVEEISVSVSPSMEPSLSSKESDPWTKFKVDENKWAYRGVNKKPNLLRQREASGWKVVSEAPEHGDLVLAKIPREISNIRQKQQQDMTKRQSQAATEGFREAAAQSGVKTFEEK